MGANLDFNLYSWFTQNKRDLPWRVDISPYRVWVSEVMLQQTQAKVVIPYFERWMQLFPTLDALARADFSSVLKVWEGLGYYQRVRNLYQGAQEVLKEYQGILPSDKKKLEAIKGIGPYTASAILAFAFQKKEAAVDGNVIRVFSRLFCIEEDIQKSQTRKKIIELAEEVVQNASYPLSEAWIELGALVCQKEPDCRACPIQKDCQAYQKQKQRDLPIKGKKGVYIDLKRAAYLFEYKGELLVQLNQKGLMQDLYEFPYIDFEEEIPSFPLFHMEGLLIRKLPPIKQTFTKFRVDLHSFHYLVKKKRQLEGYEWLPIDRLQDLPFSSGHRKLFNRFMTSYAS